MSTTSHTQLAMKTERKEKQLSTCMVSNTFEYGKNWNDAIPGDLVVATASEIDHPAYKSGKIVCSYFFGSCCEVCVFGLGHWKY